MAYGQGVYTVNTPDKGVIQVSGRWRGAKRDFIMLLGTLSNFPNF